MIDSDFFKFLWDAVWGVIWEIILTIGIAGILTGISIIGVIILIIRLVKKRRHGSGNH